MNSTISSVTVKFLSSVFGSITHLFYTTRYTVFDIEQNKIMECIVHQTKIKFKFVLSFLILFPAVN
jgi:hypothetical protein